jgi:hypothetical protein
MRTYWVADALIFAHGLFPSLPSDEIADCCGDVDVARASLTMVWASSRIRRR